MGFSPVKPRDNQQMDILPQHLMISYGVLPTLDFIGHFSGSRLTQVGIEFPWVGMDNRKYPKFQVSSSCLACYVFFYVFNYKQYLFGIHFDFDIHVLIRPIYI